MDIPHPPSRVLLQLLFDVAIVVDRREELKWQGFFQHLPPEGTYIGPDCVVINDEAGNLEGRSQTTGKAVSHEGWQVRIRSKDNAEGWTKARQILEQFESVLRNQVSVDGTDYLIQAINRSTDVIPLGRDPETQRFNHTLNGTLTFRKI